MDEDNFDWGMDDILTSIVEGDDDEVPEPEQYDPHDDNDDDSVSEGEDDGDDIIRMKVSSSPKPKKKKISLMDDDDDDPPPPKKKKRSLIMMDDDDDDGDMDRSKHHMKVTKQPRRMQFRKKGEPKRTMPPNPPKKQQTQRKQRNVSSEKVSVSGKFKVPYESGGYQSHLNPQVEFFITDFCQVKMSFEIPDRMDPPIVFFLTKPRRNYGRVAKLVNNDEEVIDRTPFVLSRKVSLSAALEPGRYVAVLCLSKPDLVGSFTFSVKTTIVVDRIRVLPDFDRRFVTGSWKTWNGGFGSVKNPQIMLHIQKKSRVVIRLMDKNRKNPLFMFITKQSKPGKRRLVVSGKDVIEKTEMVRTDTLQLDIDLEPTTSGDMPYIIIPCNYDKQNPYNFTISVESDLRGCFGEFREIIEQESSYSKRESTCEDILDKHRDYENPPYMITDPVPDIIAYCEANNCRFVDGEFKSCEKSINKSDGREDIQPLEGVVGWKRPDEFLETPDLYCDGIEIQDMRQGRVGDCWLCQGIATSCMKEDRISSLISPKGYSKYGVYSLQMYHEDAWKYMVIDDYFPIDKYNEFVFARSQDPNEIFVPLMEKAFAKAFGSYRNLTRRSMSVALEFLTGGETSVKFHDKTQMEELWNTLQVFDSRNWLMGASSKDNNETSLGIQGKHAYSIMSVHDLKKRNVRLIKIRNTWGNFEWSGRWGDDDEVNWTPDLKKKLNFQNLDDGIFHMCLEDYYNYFASTSFCRIVKDQYPYSYKYRGDWGAPNPWCSPERLRGEEAKKLPLRVLENGTGLHITLVRTSNDIKVEDNAIMLFMLDGEVKTNVIPQSQILFETRYMISIKVMIEEKVDKGLYTLIPTSSNRNEEFTVIVDSDKKVEFGEDWKDPHPFQLSVKGPWTPCAGVLRWENPVFTLLNNSKESKKNKTEVIINLKRLSDDPQKLGMLIILAKPEVDYKRPKRHPQCLQSEIVSKSKYVGASELSLTVDNLHYSDKPYLILICLEKEVSGSSYELNVKANNPIALTNDREKKSVAKVGKRKRRIEM